MAADAARTVRLGPGPACWWGWPALAITQPVLDLMGRNPEFFVAGALHEHARSSRSRARRGPGALRRAGASPTCSSRLAHRGIGARACTRVLVGGARRGVRQRARSAGSASTARAWPSVAARRWARRVAVLLVRDRGRAAAPPVPGRRQRALPRRRSCSPAPPSALARRRRRPPTRSGSVSVPVPPGSRGRDRLRRAPAADADDAPTAPSTPSATPPSLGWRPSSHVVPQRQQPAQPHRAGGAGHRHRQRASTTARCRPTASTPAQPALAAGHDDARRSATSRSPTSARGTRARRATASRSRRPSRTRWSCTGTACCPPALREDLPADRRRLGQLRRHGGRGAAAPAVGRGAVDPQPTTRSRAGTARTTPSARRDPGRPPRRARRWPIDADPALHFIHVVTPARAVVRHAVGHHADAARCRTWRTTRPTRDSEWSSLIRYQRHSLQTGAADVALGEVLDHLEDDRAVGRHHAARRRRPRHEHDPARRRAGGHRQQRGGGAPRAASSSRPPARRRARSSTTSP